jgi:L-ascorbate metabolism protein UlaG (beta-lactamase superfamily)
MQVTYLGHAAFMIETKGKKLMVDPFISANDLAKDIDVDSLKPDYILLTHGHQDHVLDAERIAKHSNASIIAAFEIVSWYAEKGINGHGMNIGGKFDFDFGQLKMVAAVHSSVLPDGTYGGNPGGFVISNEEGCLYIAGDTALTEDMKLLPRIAPAIDMAILPIGDNFTMGYEDALIAAEFIQCKRVMACHFDTFPPIKINHEQALAHFQKAGLTLVIPAIGDRVNV